MRQYIPVDTDNFPNNIEIELGGGKYLIRIDYNDVADYLTITIAKDDRVLLSGEPLLLNNLVGQDIPDRNLPLDDIRVMDESGQALDAGFVNFGSDVEMYLDEVDPNGSETDNPDATPLGYDPDEEDEESDAEGTVII
ncbi:MAG: hypothetical protein ABF490_04620 [Lentilactobacillus hilgardii]|uniref:phage baseplate plug family protein n=1 Tax=Lentilactobacillus hilgardii TaxID=1588 RepID=UPI001CC1E145|nr:hypothetical protein [Lentilactobacillus hilgardii]MBZ2200510.1 hypothetical protein [Lentilactobacillus hilgardii]MBZ2204614.1 hypothetical protein [Lentilactobacillus hilgardii]